MSFRARRSPQRGMVLMAVLVALAILALMVTHTSQQMAENNRRERETELLFVGEQYRQAILSFWRDSPGGVRRWPTGLDELVEDRRFPMPRRHLRRLYADPMAPGVPWGLVTQGAAILGVYSTAAGEPFRQAGFLPNQAKFVGGASYADWRFVVELTVPVGPAGAASAGATKPLPSGPGGQGSNKPSTFTGKP